MLPEKIERQKPERQPASSVRSSNRYPEQKLLELAGRLTERVKELNCLYGMSHLFEDASLSVDDILQGVINLMPPAWQYPDITCVRIKARRREYTTTGFRETSWRQTQTITVNGKIFGTIEVYYLAEKPVLDEGPFLKEERNLLYVISERLGHMIERQMAVNNVKSLYQRERELRKKLQSEIRVRADFTRKLIHELKTPLTALIATSQLLFDELEGERLEKLSGYIRDSASNLNIRIEELHDLIRSETGILKINPRKMDIAPLLHSLVDETQALCRQSNMPVDLYIEKDLPCVLADPDRIRQVVLNLVNNALKYAKEGQGIRIEATRKGGSVQVEVKDYGPGIPEERLSSIFEPGYQQTHAEERSGGLGIGLALCKAIIDQHGGEIWVKSKMDKGSSFFFTLPAGEN